MAEDTATAAATTATTATTAATTTVAAPWYDGKADAELIGHFQSKGWDKDPIVAAIEAGKAHRQLEKHFGAPADQIIRLPKDAKDEAGWNAVWNRLGVPKDAKEYDFSAVKFADGTAIDDSFADMIRQTAISQRIPKDAATAFAQGVVKFMEQADLSDQTERQAKIAADRAALDKQWGPNKDINRLTAMQAAKRLGVAPEAIDALEGQIGYAAVMEMFRKIGAATSEDTFVDGRDTAPKTAQSATARLSELQADAAWRERFLKGDAQARREFEALTEQIAAAA